jgi:pimeloyl-ACP methyl ester carboxylesterase
MARALMLRLARRLTLMTLPVLALVAGGTAPQAATPTPCAAIAAAEPQAGHKSSAPVAAPALFAKDFPVLYDCEWGFQLGGWGGVKAGGSRKHTPVVFVHGNQADAENWFLVKDYFTANAGYTDQEMYALSYNGIENGYAGLPSCCPPAPESTAYWQNTSPTPYYEFCCAGGNGASDDPNVPDLYAFIQAVRQYTGSQKIDIVAHSLGVTITRKLLLVHPELRADVVAAVLIAGANHGTSVCRGIEASYYGCEEIAPGTAWLKLLNAAGEAPGPTKWMSVYNGTDSTDPFFVSSGAFDDTKSPQLEGAVNLTFPMTYHNDLRVRPDIVKQYLAFLLAQGQAPAVVTPPAVPAQGPYLPNTSP